MTFKEASKTGWSTASGAASAEQIQVGCLQRIADASELMAKGIGDLQKENENLKTQLADRKKRVSELYAEKSAMYNTMSRRISSLKGVITKLKKGGAK